MYRRLIILSVVLVAAVCGLSGLGYHAIAKWAQGLEGIRLGEFAEVAEQIRQDVKRKLDDFVQAEQQRKYTDYLYYYAPENVAQRQQQQQLPLLRSPLGGQFSNSLAYGYFQVDADGSIVTPYSPPGAAPSQDGDATARETQRLESNIRDNVLPSITSRSGALRLPERETVLLDAKEAASSASAKENTSTQTDEGQKVKGARSKAYPIESLKQETQQAQVFTQQRSVANFNEVQAARQQSVTQMDAMYRRQADSSPARSGQAAEQVPAAAQEPVRGTAQDRENLPSVTPPTQVLQPQAGNPQDMVQIRIEPFVPLVVPGPNAASSIFGGQVFLLRHVQIEDRRLLQGFQLDEAKLIAEVQESARRFIRDGMAFELPQVARINGRTDAGEGAAYTAVLDFGFGDLIVNLREIDPAWIAKRIGGLHQIYFGIIATVLAAVTLALASLWHNVRAQVTLAAKKDDFISAVSHELRTPLTSIRMYAEMLERNWVKSPDKLVEYYRNMRQESERLSRLVENVLDFARLQKGRKRYAFRLGSLNDCVGEVVEMMRPYAEQRGFTIHTDFAPMSQTPFDKDAVTQIVVNLIDNAVKYAGGASDKTIAVRTRAEGGFTVIEVEDRGPGVPHRQRKKVFEEFYRIESGKCEVSNVKSKEALQTSNLKLDTSQAPQATGTGLGLTLVKRFAEAHGGFVQIDSARPTGAIFRVALATHLLTAT
jgi:signal transduction histidine kinase